MGYPGPPSIATIVSPVRRAAIRVGIALVADVERAGHVTGAIERDGDMPASGAIARTARMLGRHRGAEAVPWRQREAEGRHGDNADA